MSPTDIVPAILEAVGPATGDAGIISKLWKRLADDQCFLNNEYE